jgi:hypothetical protein
MSPGPLLGTSLVVLIAQPPTRSALWNALPVAVVCVLGVRAWQPSVSGPTGVLSPAEAAADARQDPGNLGTPTTAA